MTEVKPIAPFLMPPALQEQIENASGVMDQLEKQMAGLKMAGADVSDLEATLKGLRVSSEALMKTFGARK